jgi:clan AA aspartic protease
MKRNIAMGYVHAEIELINGIDLVDANRGRLDTDEVKRITISALVDTGSIMLAINENIQEYLQLPVVETKRMQLADGQIIACKIVSPVELRFKNRATTCRAMVLPGDAEPLLGAIPLEDMDVLIHPLRQELIVNPNHPNMAHVRG